jgi:hypothetical protein
VEWLVKIFLVHVVNLYIVLERQSNQHSIQKHIKSLLVNCLVLTAMEK